jgi:serine/threonine-protein kinase RsbW
MTGEIDAPWLRLELTSRPESARLVRSMSSAAGEALGFDPELLSDVNTAVTEACNNVIVHAYGGEPGPMSVELRALPAAVEVRICDRGSGIRGTVPDHGGLKVGLALISAVADRAEFITVPDGGTEVRLSFRPPSGWRDRSWATERGAGEVASAWQAELHSGLNGDVVLTVSPVSLLAPVLGRIGRSLAPSAGFSLQRCADV